MRPCWSHVFCVQVYREREGCTMRNMAKQVLALAVVFVFYGGSAWGDGYTLPLERQTGTDYEQHAQAYVHVSGDGGTDPYNDSDPNYPAMPEQSNTYAYDYRSLDEGDSGPEGRVAESIAESYALAECATAPTYSTLNSTLQ